MQIASSARELPVSASSRSIFVPTMGALHDGHVSLVRQAVALAERIGATSRPGTGTQTSTGTGAQGGRPPVVVSIFVNPTQFGPNEDFTRYPRTLDADVHACASAGADWVFAPAVDEVYPPSGAVRTPPLPRVATEPRLEDAARPDHFAGVCQVVKRLFDLVNPSHAVFGEKDWQQLQVVRAMVAAERLPIKIVPGATVREPDGLAMSSRNRFLTPADRELALTLIRALRAVQAEATPDAAESLMRHQLLHAGITPDYAVVRDAETLSPRRAGEPLDPTRPGRAVLAARVGSVRLLDNVAWPESR